MALFYISNTETLDAKGGSRLSIIQSRTMFVILTIKISVITEPIELYSSRNIAIVPEVVLSNFFEGGGHPHPRKNERKGIILQGPRSC